MQLALQISNAAAPLATPQPKRGMKLPGVYKTCTRVVGPIGDEELEHATRARWHDAEIDAYLTDLFGEQAQILHEAALGRQDSPLPGFSERAEPHASECVAFLGFEGGSG